MPNTALTVAISWVTHMEPPSHNTSIQVPLPRSNITHVVPDTYHLTPVSSDKSSFSLAARGFCNPVRFQDSVENDAFSELVVESVDQPGNASCPGVLLQTDARFDVQSTSHIDEVWNASLETFPYVTWRFIATHYTGVLRTFPGRTITEKFDATSAPWYRRGLAYQGNFVASVPYPADPSGDTFSDSMIPSSNIIYFSRLVPYTTSLPPAPPTPATTITYGVVGMSLTYNSFSNMFLSSVATGPGCTYDKIYTPKGVRCFIMDGSGYVITHPSFLHSNPPSNKSYIFVGDDEPLLAESLANSGILSPVKTMDFSQGIKAQLLTYTIAESNFTRNDTDGTFYAMGPLIYSQDCLQMGFYYISKLSTSNMYLVVLNITQSSVCVHRSLSISATPVSQDLCDTNPMERGVNSCPVQGIPNNMLDQMRGIQSCKSNTHAILMGLLIPFGIGLGVVLVIWFVKRRRSRSLNADLGYGGDGGEHAREEVGSNVAVRIGPNVNDGNVNVEEIELDNVAHRPASSPNPRSSMRRSSSGARDVQSDGRRVQHARSRSTTSNPSLRSRNNGGSLRSRDNSNSSLPSRSSSRSNMNNVSSPSAQRNNTLRGSQGVPSPAQARFYDGPYGIEEAREEGEGVRSVLPLPIMVGGRAIVNTFPTSPPEPLSERSDSEASSLAHVQLENDDVTDDVESSNFDDADEADEGEEDEDSELGERNPDDVFGSEMGLARPPQVSRT